MTKKEHAFFDQHLCTFFYQSVYEPVNLDLYLSSSSESQEEEELTDTLLITRSYISDTEIYNTYQKKEDFFTQQTQKVLDIKEKTFKEKNDDG